MLGRVRTITPERLPLDLCRARARKLLLDRLARDLEAVERLTECDEGLLVCGVDRCAEADERRDDRAEDADARGADLAADRLAA